MRNLLTSLLGVVLVLVSAALIQRYIAKPFLIPSKSMAQTLQQGDRVLVTRWGEKIKRGDIIVFYAPRGAGRERCGDNKSGPGTGKPCQTPFGGQGSQPYIKRVVGLPGDSIAVKQGVLMRNERPVKESYAEPCRAPDLCEMPIPITVPPGSLYLMGDNRSDSADSRVWGPASQDWVIGKARLLWWPFSRLEML